VWVDVLTNETHIQKQTDLVIGNLDAKSFHILIPDVSGRVEN
jgi:hypothetical protein